MIVETVAQWNGPIFLLNRPLVGNGKYCSWEPGRSRQAGALAVVTVTELLRNSDESSMERKEEELVGGGGGIIFIGGAKKVLARELLCGG